MTFPSFALMATRYPSRLPKKSVLPCTASPRFTPNSSGKPDGIGRLYSQITAPVFAFKAKTCPGSADMNIVPSITSGVGSMFGSLMSNCVTVAYPVVPGDCHDGLGEK